MALACIDRIIPSRYRGEALLRAIAVLRDCECELMAVALECRTEREFGRFCARVRDRPDPDGPEPVEGSWDSEITPRQKDNGRWTLFGDLHERDGAIWSTLLEERVRRQRLARRNGSGDDTEPDTMERKAYPVELAEAMGSLLLDGAGASRPGRVGLYVHLDLDDLAVRGADVRPMAHTEANHDITVDSLWGLLADADLTPIMCDSGTPLTYGRTQRLAPPILRRVIAHPDLRCGFPGCESPAARNDAHHPWFWEDGGTTDPTNTRGTCGCHHHACHDRGWTLEPPGDGGPGDYRVTRPDGTPFDPTPMAPTPPPPRPRPRRRPARSARRARLTSATSAARPQPARPPADGRRKDLPRRQAPPGTDAAPDLNATRPPASACRRANVNQVHR